MIVFAAGSWSDAIADQPGESLVAVLSLTAAAVAGGYALRALTRRTRTLRNLVLAITLASLLIGALAWGAVGAVRRGSPASPVARRRVRLLRPWLG